MTAVGKAGLEIAVPPTIHRCRSTRRHESPQCSVRSRSPPPGELEAITERFVPELVVCDLGLPGVDGDALLGVLRNKFSGTPFHAVALTGYSHIEDRDPALQSGFDSFQVKPIQAAIERAADSDLKQA